MKTSQFADGPGAGVAAYEWRNLTLGSDTGGSIRGPSACAILNPVPLTRGHTARTVSGESCSERILFHSGASGSPNSRNTHRTAPEAPTGFIIGRVLKIAGVPDVVFLLGQASYQSTLMLKTEFLPLTVDIMAAKGCDSRLLELAAALKKAGILKTPKTGSLALLKKGPGIMEFGPDNRKKRANV
ncbi:hypothetical protein WAI453_012070 [Rhynchosporium graminicola]